MNATDETVWPDGYPSRLVAGTHGGLVTDVYLDGERTEYVIELDRSEGWVRVWKTDEDGKHIYVDWNAADVEPLTEIRRGEVRVEFAAPWRRP